MDGLIVAGCSVWRMILLPLWPRMRLFDYAAFACQSLMDSGSWIVDERGNTIFLTEIWTDSGPSLVGSCIVFFVCFFWVLCRRQCSLQTYRITFGVCFFFWAVGAPFFDAVHLWSLIQQGLLVSTHIKRKRKLPAKNPRGEKTQDAPFVRKSLFIVIVLFSGVVPPLLDPRSYPIKPAISNGPQLASIPLRPFSHLFRGSNYFRICWPLANANANDPGLQSESEWQWDRKWEWEWGFGMKKEREHSWERAY